MARTLLDLGAVLALRGVERAFDQAEVLEVLDIFEIQRVLHEGSARPGAAKLRAVVARDAAGSTVTDNGLGELMLAIIRRAGLPEPICQAPVLQYVAGFCWPVARLIVEADGRSHDTRTGRLRDARRDVALQNAGWRVLRFPKREILGDPAYVGEAIRRTLVHASVGSACFGGLGPPLPASGIPSRTTSTTGNAGYRQRRPVRSPIPHGTCGHVH